MGIIEKVLIFIGFILTFNIITTKRNKTAIAPTYTIKNKKEKNSAPKIKSKQAILQNTRIKNKTEWTALLNVITMIEDINAKIAKK